MRGRHLRLRCSDTVDDGSADSFMISTTKTGNTQALCRIVNNLSISLETTGQTLVYQHQENIAFDFSLNCFFISHINKNIKKLQYKVIYFIDLLIIKYYFCFFVLLYHTLNRPNNNTYKKLLI